MKKKMLNKKGFTLIELIVVITVIGILVLLAAPKFLGYTKDANVAAMKADTKILSNAAAVYNIDNDKWPVAYTAEGTIDNAAEKGTVKIDSETVDAKAYKIDYDKLKGKYVKNLKDKNMDNYVIIIDGRSEYDGEVFYINGVTDKIGDIWVNESLKFDKFVLTP